MQYQPVQEQRARERFDFDQACGIGQTNAVRDTRANVGRTRNISEDGLGFLFHRRLAPGSTCLLRIVSVDGEKVDLGATIKYCTPSGSDMYFIGAQWDRPLNLEHFIPRSSA